MPTRQLWLVAPERYSLRSYPAAGHPVWVGMTFYSNSGTQTLLEFTHLTVTKGIADFLELPHSESGVRPAGV